jgi:succinate dehydrogenase/fumarate reductase flavoprotein subunit
MTDPKTADAQAAHATTTHKKPSDAKIVPQEILDALTRVDMPAIPAIEPGQVAEESLTIGTHTVRVLRTGALVLGSGAAGLRAAVEMHRRGTPTLIASMSPFGGTSACSGSDKQTLHTAGTGNRGDDFNELAEALSAGGGMDADTAYAEAVGSITAFAGLQYLGLPLPQDRFGAVLRYQTDHDEKGRATSCGPRTSRLMVKVLAEEALQLGIPWMKKCEGIRLLTAGSGSERRCIGMLCIDQERRDAAYGLTVILAEAVVLATGGPGELYRDSVYPRHCYGSLGLAIEAGVSTCNLTESQFGIGTRRTEFPWNLSGTYVQVLPYIFSRDNEGNEYNFLADYYRTTRELASNIFRKGYQWPFHATRMEDFNSSLVDLAIFQEAQKGRTILMDFNRNPLPANDGAAFSLENLDEDVRAYLENNDALQEMPIDRLKRMNPLAIELYRMHGNDIEAEPLPFNVSNQHMNGGIAVDPWNESSLHGCFAVGEVSGTHGVTRPGGAALNAGQVGGMRVADQVASRSLEVSTTAAEAVSDTICDALTMIETALATDNGINLGETRDAIQSRMSDYAGFICQVANVPGALQAAAELRQKVAKKGFTIARPTQAVDIFRWWHLALTSEAVLVALDDYIHQGGGSRGARAYLAADGDVQITGVNGPISGIRYRREKEAHKQVKKVVTWQPAAQHFAVADVPLRTREDAGGIFFEKNWANYLTGTIYHAGFRHSVGT